MLVLHRLWASATRTGKRSCLVQLQVYRQSTCSDCLRCHPLIAAAAVPLRRHTPPEEPNVPSKLVSACAPARCSRRWIKLIKIAPTVVYGPLLPSTYRPNQPAATCLHNYTVPLAANRNHSCTPADNLSAQRHTSCIMYASPLRSPVVVGSECLNDRLALHTCALLRCRARPAAKPHGRAAARCEQQ